MNLLPRAWWKRGDVRGYWNDCRLWSLVSLGFLFLYGFGLRLLRLWGLRRWDEVRNVDDFFDWLLLLLLLIFLWILISLCLLCVVLCWSWLLVLSRVFLRLILLKLVLLCFFSIFILNGITHRDVNWFLFLLWLYSSFSKLRIISFSNLMNCIYPNCFSWLCYQNLVSRFRVDFNKFFWSRNFYTLWLIIGGVVNLDNIL